MPRPLRLRADCRRRAAYQTGVQTASPGPLVLSLLAQLPELWWPILTALTHYKQMGAAWESHCACAGV